MKASLLRKLEMECPELMKRIRPDFSDPATYELMAFFDRYAVRVTRWLPSHETVSEDVAEKTMLGVD
jgi:hypothetical protein